MNYLAIAVFGAIIILDFEILAPVLAEKGSVINTSIMQPQAVQEQQTGLGTIKTTPKSGSDIQS